MTPERHRYGRILLKLSGEALMGKMSFGIDPAVLETVATEVHEVHQLGVKLAVVMGGGNIFRGLNASHYGISRVPADHMGMLATVMNGIALAEALKDMGSETRVMSAIDMNKIVEPFIRGRALSHLSRDRIVLFAAGTGNPYFSTDTAATLRAMEIHAEALLKATKVDGIYDADPEVTPSAEPYKRITYQDVLRRKLGVMDMTAVSLAMGQELPIIVFNLRHAGNIKRVVLGEEVGTMISGDEPK